MSSALGLRETLLTAAFGTREEARLAWQQWERDSGWQEHVEFDSYLLLPQVFHNLGKDSVEDALFLRLKGIIRQNWVANSRRLALLKALLGDSRLSGKRLLVLPPLSFLSHDRSTVFSNEPVAVWLACPSDLRAFVADLRADGWLTPNRHIPRWSMHGFAAGTSTLGWRHSQYGALQLHWPRQQGRTASDWQPRNTGIQASLADLQFYCLRPADTIRYLLLAPGQGSEFRRCARAMLYLQQAGHADGWPVLLQLLRNNASELLETVLELAPPGVAATAQGNLPPEQGELAVEGAGRLPFFRKLGQHWSTFCQDLGEHCGALKALAALPGYLMGKWDLDHPLEIPSRLLRGAYSDYRHRSRNSG